MSGGLPTPLGESAKMQPFGLSRFRFLRHPTEHVHETKTDYTNSLNSANISHRNSISDRDSQPDALPLVRLSTSVRRHSSAKGQSNHEYEYDGTIVSAKTEAWNSVWLRKSTLFAILILWLILLAAVVLLQRLAALNNGISKQHFFSHYEWTYLPTFIFVAAAALWHQIDHQCKAMIPWKQMLISPSSSERSLLLDYLSPNPLTTLLTSIRFHHWAVTATVSGSFLLDLAIIFSTSLLVLAPVDMIDLNATIPIKTSFSNQPFNRIAAENVLIAYWGVAFQGLQLPFGITKNAAFEVPDLTPGKIANGTYTVDVQSFRTDMNCSIAKMETYLLPFTQTTPNATKWTNATTSTNASNSTNATLNITYDSYAVNISTPFCNIKGLTYPIWLDLMGWEGADPLPRRVLSGKTIYSGISLLSQKPRMPCQSEDEWFGQNVTGYFVTDLRSSLPPLTMKPYVLTNVTYPGNFTAVNNAAVICIPSYSIQKSTLKFRAETQELVNFTIAEKKESLTGFSTQQLANIPYYGTDRLSWDLISLIPYDPYGDDPTWRLSDYTFQFLPIANNNSTLEGLLDPDVLLATVQSFNNQLGALYAGQHFVAYANNSVKASRLYTENRLVVSDLSVVIIGAVLGLLVLFSLLVLFTRPVDVLPHSPVLLRNQAAILAASPALNQQLDSLGSLSDEELQHALFQQHYQISFRTGSPFSIQVINGSDHYSRPVNTSEKWWRPWASYSAFIIPLIVPAVAFIAIMEFLEQKTQSHADLLNVSTARKVASTLTTVLPAFLMVLLKQIYQWSSFSFLAFAPFERLQRCCRLDSKSLKHRVGQLPIITLLASLRNREASLALISVAVLFGSFMSTIAAGLFTVQSFDSTQNVNLTTLDYFNLTWTGIDEFDEYRGNQAGLFYSLQDQFNSSYQPLVYDGFAFPNISMHIQSPKNASSSLQETFRLRTRLPAIRAVLDCEFLPSDELSTDWDDEPVNNYTSQFVSYIPPTPKECLGANTSYSAKDSQSFFQYDLNTSLSASFVAAMDYTWASDEFAFTREYPGGSSAVCVTLAFLFQHVTTQQKTSENQTAFTCYQRLEQVDTNVTFLLPSWTIDPTNPPNADETTKQVLVSSAQFWPFAASDITKFTAKSSVLVSYNNPFLEHLVYGVDGTPLEDLIGFSNRDRLLNATRHAYSKYLAIVISRNMRLANNASSKTALLDFPGTLVNGTILRVVQHKEPKMALQVVLGVMAICATLAYIITPMGRTLPHNPLTIAGVMSLLAGSRLCGTGGTHQDEKLRSMPPDLDFVGAEKRDGALQEVIVKMGQFEDTRIQEGNETASVGGQNVKPRYRYGIDIVDNNELFKNA